MALTINEIYRIKKMAEKIQRDLYTEASRSKILEDMSGLKLEIMEELGMLYPLLLVYLSLAGKERYRFDPLVLYEAGKNAKRSGADRKKALFSYFNQEALTPEVEKLYADMQRYHSLIIRCLGDKKGLVTELLDEYRFVYGGINRSAELFFTMGYNSHSGSGDQGGGAQ